MEDKKDFSYFSSEVLEINEVDIQDIKINPDVYIHYTLVQLGQVLANAKDDTGYRTYFQMVGHLEGLCIGAEYLPNDYDKQLKDFSATEEYKKLDNSIVKQLVYNNKKIQIMLKGIFSKKPLKSPLKM